MQDINWNDLRHVLAVARTGGLAAAARHLRVDETTVSRRIARAEAILGSRLFHRVEGALLPTEIGRGVIERAERAELEIDALCRSASGADAAVAGSVRVTSIPLLVSRLLVPALPQLYDRHPLLRIELVAEARNLEVTKRDADIALRLARPYREQRSVARRIGVLDYAVYGPAGRKKQDALPWIAFEDTMSALPHVAWIAKAIRRERVALLRLVVNDAEIALQAIVAGLGKSLLPCVIADGVPGVARLSGRSPVLARELWLIVHPELRQLAKVRAVMAWIEGTVRKLKA